MEKISFEEISFQTNSIMPPPYLFGPSQEGLQKPSSKSDYEEINHLQSFTKYLRLILVFM